jgi:hypothetical protein
MMLGRRTGPSGTYIDEYDATTDASGKSRGGKYTQLAMTGTPAAVAGAPSIDTNANRGTYVQAARVMTDSASAATTTYRGRSTVTGSGVAAATSEDTQQPYTATVRGVRTMALLGEISIPAGAVPDVSTGSGYADESAIASQTGHAVNIGLDRVWRYGASFTNAGAMLHTGFAFWFGSDSMGRSLTVGLFTATGTTPLATVSMNAGTLTPDSEVRVNFSTPLEPGSYRMGLLTGGTAIVKGAGVSAPYFVAYAAAALGFNTTTPVLGACSESSKTLSLDYAVRVPCDEFYCCVDNTSLALRNGANAGFMLDCADPLKPMNVYYAETTAANVGPSVLLRADVRGMPYLPPVEQTLVGVGCEGDVAPGALTLAIDYLPTFADPRTAR